MWEWDTEVFVARRLADDPAVAAFAAGLMHPRAAAPDRIFLTSREMQALPLVEWDMQGEENDLFALLRAAGSARGFFLDHPDAANPGTGLRECSLSEASADAISRERLFGYEFLFTDDRLQLAIVNWYSDFTWLCMRPALFARYLARRPLDLSLDGGGPEVSCFEDALKAAFRRIEAWDPRLSAVIRHSEWQLSPGA